MLVSGPGALSLYLSGSMVARVGHRGHTVNTHTVSRKFQLQFPEAPGARGGLYCCTTHGLALLAAVYNGYTDTDEGVRTGVGRRSYIR